MEILDIFKIFTLSLLILVCSSGTKTKGNVPERLAFFSSMESEANITEYDEMQEKAFREKYNIERISKLCPKTSCFSSYNPKHRMAVIGLTQGYLEQSTVNQFNQFSVHLSSLVHPRVLYNSEIRCQYLRTFPEVHLPSPIELFPSSLIPSVILRPRMLEQACMFLDGRFGSDNGIENRLWYFREDLQVNSHHLIWHLLYPLNNTVPFSRRGELFYFFHHDILARYSAERLSNDLEPTVPLDLQWGTELEQGYRSHLVDGISDLKFADREDWQKLSKESLSSEMVDYFLNFTDKRHRVMQSVDHGTVKANYSLYSIKPYDYINLLGELTEASEQSINTRYYGGDPEYSGYHDDGHWIIANMGVNLDNKPNHTEPVGIIADTLTAMRDPLFFRWHQYIDNVFQKYKITHLDPYQLYEGDFPLVFSGVKISNVRIAAEDASGAITGRFNHLETFWSIEKFDLRSRWDLKYGEEADADSEEIADVCAKHLNHEEFVYEISIENSLKSATPATVRIFMAPRFKSQKQNTFTRYKMYEQRTLFFTMDLFKVNLSPGRNFIRRRSVDSALTTPWPLSFREIKRRMEESVSSYSDTISQRTAYDCGFPHHLLLPKGNENGMVFDLFVMVTNGLDDKVQDDSNSDYYYKNYRQAPIHCGRPGKDYPDNKPLGYPFDRRPYTNSHRINLPTGKIIFENREVETLEEYVKEIPNMFATQVVIQHKNQVSGLENFVEVYVKEDDNYKNLYDELRKVTMKRRA